MKIEFKPAKTVVTMTVRPEAGCFASAIGEEIQWLKCREQFAHYFTNKTVGFYFSHKPEFSNNIAQFIAKTEEIIGVKENATYAKTNRNWILWIEPNEFWKSCLMRRSLFTILLRCGLLYSLEEDNYEYSLYSQNYIKETKEAVMRFLFGFTKYNPEKKSVSLGTAPRGWVSAFKNADRDLVNKQLVLDGEVSANLVGIGSLWA